MGKVRKKRWGKNNGSFSSILSPLFHTFPALFLPWNLKTLQKIENTEYHGGVFFGGGCFLGASASSQELVSLRQIFARAPWNWPGKRRKKCCLQKNKAETRRIQVKTLSGLTVLRSLHELLPLAWGLEFRLGDGFSPFREDELQVACLVGLPAGNEPKNKTTDTGHTHTHRETHALTCVYDIVYSISLHLLVVNRKSKYTISTNLMITELHQGTLGHFLWKGILFSFFPEQEKFKVSPVPSSFLYDICIRIYRFFFNNMYVRINPFKYIHTYISHHLWRWPVRVHIWTVLKCWRETRSNYFDL